MSSGMSSGYRAMDICARLHGEALARLDDPQWKPKYRDPHAPPPVAQSERLRRAGRIACGLRTNEIIEAGFRWREPAAPARENAPPDETPPGRGPAAPARENAPPDDTPPDLPPPRRLWAVGGGHDE